jgi:hypothetical protein
VGEAQSLQYAILGYLPGFATPRFVCDVPYVGKRWVHMLDEYDRTKGISYWRKNYRTGIEATDPDALTRQYHYYDPIYTLPEEGQEWWRREIEAGLRRSAASARAARAVAASSSGLGSRSTGTARSNSRQNASTASTSASVICSTASTSRGSAVRGVETDHEAIACAVCWRQFA